MSPVNVDAAVSLAIKALVQAALIGAPVAVTGAQPPEACPPAAAEQRDEALRFYQAGTTSVLAEDWEEALPALEQAGRLDPRLVLAHYARGQALMALKQYREAVEAYLDCREAFRCARALSDTEQAESRKRLEREIAEVREALRFLEGSRHVEQSILERGMPGTDAPRPGAGSSRAHLLEQQLHELERWQKGDGARPPAVLSLALGNAYFQAGSLPEAEREFRGLFSPTPAPATPTTTSPWSSC